MNYSGKFVVRIDPKLHQNLVGRAGEEGVSLNQICNRFLTQGLTRVERPPLWKVESLQVLPYLKKRFGRDLLAMAVFGSRVQGRATPSSDLDILILLGPAIPIQRSLYLWWEETLPQSKAMERSPHFVHLPQKLEEAGGFWFEFALNSEILYEKKKVLSRWRGRLQKYIESGKVFRQWSHGHPYWVREKERAS